MEQTKQHLPQRYLVRCGPASPTGDDSAEPAPLDRELPCIAAPRCKALVKVSAAFAAHAKAIGCPWTICEDCKVQTRGMVDRAPIEVVPKHYCTDCKVRPVRKYTRCPKCRAKTNGMKPQLVEVGS